MDSKPFVAADEKLMFLLFLLRSSISNRVINIAVNKEVPIPMSKVVANPLIGPVPKTNKISAVNPVVILASKMEESALLNPSGCPRLRKARYSKVPAVPRPAKVRLIGG